jgi:anti-sigma factor RsiW
MPDLLNRLFHRHRHDDLSCRELVELVTDYLEDALPSAERARFESHIATCDGCDAYLIQMRETIVVLGTLPADALSSTAEERLRAAFRDWRAGQAPQP